MRKAILLVVIATFACQVPPSQNNAKPRGIEVEVVSRRRALVIGNRNYSMKPLLNPVNDANKLAQALRETGFTVTLATDLNREALDGTVDKFVQSVQEGDTALFFFAGHGIEVKGQNFLLPTNFSAKVETQVKYQALNAAELQDLLQERKARTVILILDACRNNPYRSWGRDTGGGLAGMSGAGVYVAFAAAPGRMADDNPLEENGRFTKHLLAALREPGLGIDDVFNQVRSGVAQETGGDQVPFSNSGLLGRFVFREAAPREIIPSTPKRPEPVVVSRAPYVNPKDGLQYVWIAPGSFVMGCSDGDGQCDTDENPHRVTITRGFRIGATPVTQAAYQRVIGTNPSYFKGPRLPVESVSWDDARKYCSAVGMRLPTEAEWEYAARAGTSGARYGELDAIAWYDQNSGSKTHDVGTKQPNAWGLYDMLGNVWQWTADWYGPYAATAATDPAGAASGEYRSLRGGSWYNVASYARASWRFWYRPSIRLHVLGFRCAGE